MQNCFKNKYFLAFCEICSRTYSINGPENADPGILGSQILGSSPPCPRLDKVTLSTLGQCLHFMRFAHERIQ